MSGDERSSSRHATSSAARSSVTKRDSIAAELERGPQYMASKRQARAAPLASRLTNASTERELLALKTTKVGLETKLREQDILIERLERDRRWLSEREKEEREAKDNAEREVEIEKTRLSDEIRALRSELATIREDYVDLQESSSYLSLSTSQTISAQSSETARLKSQISVLTASLKEVQTLAEERKTTVADLHNQLDALVSQEKGADVANENNSWNVVRDELHRQASYLHQLELTNSNLMKEVNELRDRKVNIEVLKEENRTLDMKVRVMEDLRTKLVRAEAEVEAARKEREGWSKTCADITQTKALSDLRLSHASLLEEHGSILAQLKLYESEITSLQANNQELLDQASTLQNEIGKLQGNATRKEEKWRAGERENLFLRALLASYSAEFSLDPQINTSSVTNDRIQRLEALLSEYKQIRSDFDGQAAPLSSGGEIPPVKIADQVSILNKEKAVLEQELKDMRDASSKMEQEIESLSQQLFDLGGEIAGGRYVLPGTRILALRDNPAQQWADSREAVLNQLRNENRALLRRLADVGGSEGERGSQNEGLADRMVPLESWDLLLGEKKDLEETVRQKEKRLLRLQQVFASKSAEFREAVATVLGLKLAFYPNGQVRVTSIFDLGASFVFQPTQGTSTDGEGVKMQLVAQGEGGPQDLPQLMRYWIEEEECIPGFLASVTLECWDKMKKEKV